MALKIGPWGAARAAPSAAPAQPPDEVARFPCRSCGASLGYRPGTFTLTCPFCGAENPTPEAGDRSAALREQDFEAALRAGADAAIMEATQIVHCDSCGADVEFDPAEQAKTCPFCASPLVAPPRADRHIRPQALLPFAIDEAEARAALARWLQGLWFAPSGLSRYARRGALSGVYAPHWTFDAHTETAYSGQRGDAVRRTRRGPKGQTQSMTEIRWRPARGRVARAFDDVLARGSTSLSQAEADRLAPWDLTHLAPYAPDWLAGFRAEAYTVDLRAAFVEARRTMDAQIAQDVRRDIGGDQQRIDRIDTRISDVTFKHVLLPVWVGAYRWRGKPYRVLVNGRTGRVSGARPWSVWKIALAVVSAAAVAAALFWLFSQGGGPQLY
ncbi:MAG: primosomal protein N' (replication factor Y) - superfamily II helicase [Rubrimonas sp.]|uniref:primosomal protein N' (replication factor Y) - superfamily II helicase n=1 Tax=Rubrimonas sp. TaxID=2036015 RepID=UPI002FDE4D95